MPIPRCVRILLPGLAVLVLMGAGNVPTAGFVNWPAYQFGAAHGSYNPSATAITAANAASLVQAWKWVPAPPTMTGQPVAQLNASPTVYNGRIYIGAKTGVFYALNETTGAVAWQRFIGFQPKLTCAAQGFVSTATVAPDPSTGSPTVYVGAPTGEVYALDASDGSVRWSTKVVTPSSTVNDYFLWSSPAVANGRVYIGISSACDKPLVRAGVVALNQADGAIVGTYYTEAAGQKGASVWSSVAVDPGDGSVFVSTGNPASKTKPGDAYSIVRLDGQTMQKTGIWTVPVSDQTSDADFGASPVLFTATIGGVSTGLVAACDKNGMLYALRRSDLAAGPVWSVRIGAAGSDPNSCIGGLAWDGSRLYQGGNSTAIGGTAYNGSLRALNPDTGAPIWQTGLHNAIISTPTVNGSGVVAVGTLSFGSTTNTAYLFNAATGAVVRTFPTRGGLFGQMTFADNYVFVPTVSGGLRAYRP
jgi:outer membrane protein assembly factor BamB